MSTKLHTSSGLFVKLRRKNSDFAWRHLLSKDSVSTSVAASSSLGKQICSGATIIGPKEVSGSIAPSIFSAVDSGLSVVDLTRHTLLLFGLFNQAWLFLGCQLGCEAAPWSGSQVIPAVHHLKSSEAPGGKLCSPRITLCLPFGVNWQNSKWPGKASDPVG